VLGFFPHIFAFSEQRYLVASRKRPGTKTDRKQELNAP